MQPGGLSALPGRTQLHQRPAIWGRYGLGRYASHVNAQEALSQDMIADGLKPVQKPQAWSSILTNIRNGSRPQKVSPADGFL